MLNHNDIARMLGDSVIMLDTLSLKNNTAQGHRLISLNEDIFRGHFPSKPILPGVLQLLAMEQACRIIYMNQKPGTEPVLHRVHRIKFRQPVYPGQRIDISCTMAEDECTFQAKVTLENGEVASSGSLELCEPPEAWRTLAPGEITCHNGAVTGDDILKAIPHRSPFVLLDGVYDITDTHLCGYKNLPYNDSFIQSKGQYPACFQIESCAQLGCYAMMSRPEYKGKLGLFMSVDQFTVHRPVMTGERLEMELSMDSRSQYGIGTGTCHAGGELAAEIALKFVIV